MLLLLCCTSCGTKVSVESANYSCPRCSGILDLRYPSLSLDEIGVNGWTSSGSGVWKYRDRLPVQKYESVVSLQEGNTPLIKLKNLGELVYAKDETRNPTGSFKDRPNTVGMSKALELGAATVAVASSGNAAGSLSAYAAKAKIPCVVCVPENTPPAKLNQIIVFGAKVVRVKGSYSESFRLIKESCHRFGWHNLTSVCSANPYQVEGDKTAAFEIYEQLEKSVPSWVIIPLGAGPLLVGISKGFQELRDAGLVNKIPRLVGVQAAACAPIVRAFKSGDNKVSAWTEASDTVAHSISDPLVGYSQDGTYTLLKIRESNGVAEEVDDKEIMSSLEVLARSEGIFVEPAAAASLAAFLKLKRAGTIGKEEKVVLMLTGTGLKSSYAAEDTSKIKTIDPDPEMLLELVTAPSVSLQRR